MDWNVTSIILVMLDYIYWYAVMQIKECYESLKMQFIMSCLAVSYSKHEGKNDNYYNQLNSTILAIAPFYCLHMKPKGK